MTDTAADALVRQLLSKDEKSMLGDWLTALNQGSTRSSGRMPEAELQTQCRDFLRALALAAKDAAVLAITDPAFETAKEVIADISRSRALQGFSPSDTANFVMSLKRPFATILSGHDDGKADVIIAATWSLNFLLDQLALLSTEIFQKSREEIVARQQEEIAELSTPVVKLWDGVLALPLIGTLDSARTQVVMETLLQAIVDQGAEIAIIDITGVPTVDTLVAQHLLKTVSAARLMGADCIISGIRPQIAQTMIHLGVELNVVSKASLSDAFALALKQTGRKVVRLAPATTRES